MLGEMATVLTYLRNHPISGRHPWRALMRAAAWQARSRVQSTARYPWIAGATLVMSRGMTGATGAVYYGLHEFPDMALLIHLLGPQDLFVDAGANVGSYTVLASRVCGSRSISIEPDPVARQSLQRNAAHNGIEHLIETAPVAVGATDGQVRFTQGLDTVNRVATDDAGASRIVEMRTLDSIVGYRVPVLIKIDVEGYEEHVIRGAQRTLAKPSLLALELETVSTATEELLRDSGFERASYDPFTRTLVPPTKKFGECNALFVRDRSEIAARVKAAVRRSIYGVEV